MQFKIYPCKFTKIIDKNKNSEFNRTDVKSGKWTKNTIFLFKIKSVAADSDSAHRETGLSKYLCQLTRNG